MDKCKKKENENVKMEKWIRKCESEGNVRNKKKYCKEKLIIANSIESNRVIEQHSHQEGDVWVWIVC